MTIQATFESVSGRGSSHHVAGLVVQLNVDGCVVADVPVEWLGLAEAPNAPGAGHRPDRCRVGAFYGAGRSDGLLDGDDAT